MNVDVLLHPRCRFRLVIEVSCQNTNKYFDMGRLTSSSTLLTFPSLFLLGFNYEVTLYRALRSTNHSFNLSSSHSFETYVRPFPNTSFVFPQFNFNCNNLTRPSPGSDTSSILTTSCSSTWSMGSERDRDEFDAHFYSF